MRLTLNTKGMALWLRDDGGEVGKSEKIRTGWVRGLKISTGESRLEGGNWNC